jgi:hypothetical protein
VSGGDERWFTKSIEALLVEIQEYLAAVDVFRREGCEPRWRRERT